MSKMHHEIEIRAPTDKIYDAITSQKGLSSWWTADSVAKPVAGSVAEFGFGDRQTVFQMRIQKLTPSKRVAWKCVGGPKEWKGTRLKWEIKKIKKSKNGGSDLRFTHSKWGSTKGDFGMCNTTWGALIYRLKDYAEGNAGDPLFK